MGLCNITWATNHHRKTLLLEMPPISSVGHCVAAIVTSQSAANASACPSLSGITAGPHITSILKKALG